MGDPIGGGGSFGDAFGHCYGGSFGPFAVRLCHPPSVLPELERR
jgi:hypothetical protein